MEEGRQTDTHTHRDRRQTDRDRQTTDRQTDRNLKKSTVSIILATNFIKADGVSGRDGEKGKRQRQRFNNKNKTKNRTKKYYADQPVQAEAPQPVHVTSQD